MKKNLLIILFCILILISVFFFNFLFNRTDPGHLVVSFLDVGQGDAIFIKTPNGKKVLIDAGPDSKVLREVSGLINFYERNIDLFIATHSDADHIGGLPEILKRFNLDKYIYNGKEDLDGLNSEILEILNKQKIDQHVATAGDKIILDHENNIYIEILWPEKDKELKDNNEYSVITRIVFNEIEFLLTGDASKDAENKISDAYEIESNVLKAGHHGSDTSTSLKFLEAVNPEYVIISAGLDNKFGHPKESVLNNISKIKAKVLETFVSSTITFETSGEELWIR